MRVPAIIYAGEPLMQAMDEKVAVQITNVASLPGIQQAAYAMPDAHWGYGFPIGGVAAFDRDEGGVVSAGGVGYDISCGVRLLRTGMPAAEIEPHKKALADALYRAIPAGVGSAGHLHLNAQEMDAMLKHGAAWAVERGYGTPSDLERTEENGSMAGADTKAVSEQAKRRQQDEVGTLGSGNHYLEVQRVDEIFDAQAAQVFGLAKDEAVVSIHCGSRGLGHQIGTEFLKWMAIDAPKYNITLPDRELACAPLRSPLGERYLGAMRAAINCALANRQVLTDLTRKAFATVFPHVKLGVVYDVSHNTCKEETHEVNGSPKRLFVHRKGATRAFGPGHREIPAAFQAVGQPVIIGGTMGTSSWVLTGTATSEKRSFSSACHGAGRAMSRSQATKQWQGREVVNELASRGILVRSPSLKGIAEEAPGAYKDVDAVVHAAHDAGLAKRVARLVPIAVVKG